MPDVDFVSLTAYAKQFSGLTPEYEGLLQEIGPQVKPLLMEVTESFYGVLQSIDKTKPFIDGKVESLKKTHLHWMETMFTGPYDENYTAWMYKVGDVHVKVRLPVEFMAGGITIIGNTLHPIIAGLCGVDHGRCVKLASAINAMLGFSLMVMQESYQASSLAAELEKFLAITGMSRTLFDNLARAYK